MRYVTYDPSGNLTGCFLQDLLPEHEAAHFPIDEASASNWPAFRMNDARDGLEVAPVVAPEPVVPQEVTRRQATEALLKRGQYDTVIAILNNPAIEPDELKRRINLNEFETSQVFERNRPLTVAMGAVLNIDLDEWFTFAGGL